MNEPGVIHGMLTAKTIAVVGLSGDPMKPVRKSQRKLMDLTVRRK